MLSRRRGTRRSRPRTPQTIRAPSASDSSTACVPSGSISGPSRAARRAGRATRGETRPARVRRRRPAHSGAVRPPGAGRCSARAGPPRGARDRAPAASPRPARPRSRARACGGARCGRNRRGRSHRESRPDAGSCTGAAAHVQPCRSRLKCSAEKICTACSSASAVPTAFVPTAASLHSAPGVKCGPQRGLEHPRVPVDPQQRPVGVADRDQMPGFRGHRAEQAADERRDGRQRMGREASGRLLGVEHHRRGAVGIDAGSRAAGPRTHDDLAQHRRRAATAEHDLMRTAQQSRTRNRVRREIHCDPRTVQRGLRSGIGCYGVRPSSPARWSSS